MNEATERLTVIMKKSLRTKLSKKADELGFDSPQALLRYASQAIVDGREVTFNNDALDAVPRVNKLNKKAPAQDP